ncbi:reelin isoform X1 [Polypterus senegalus]|uniref:reelin isoform X1 n=1 Tax=Polypterus senegalus TaxID=55291 RepID=UPI001965103B|nr:reelin isoform X1 [Polypterus senegalus]
MAVERQALLLFGALSYNVLTLAWTGSTDLGAPLGYYPRFNPFFFLCTHHGDLEGVEDQSEVLISLQIAGNPAAYIPGHEYQVTISTSTHFDGLLVTGLYTATTVQSAASVAGPGSFGFGILSERQFGTQFVCSVVTSYISHLPTTSLNFVWIAPPPGTGCINFLATATNRGQILFKDALALQLCEQGVPTESPLRPSLAQVHGEHVILRDDFESHQEKQLNPNIWSDCSGCELGERCGGIMHGAAVSFCEPLGRRELVTVPLNTSSASVLQFALGSGSCRFSFTDPDIVVSYSRNNSEGWTPLEKIRAPSNSTTVIHLLHVSAAAKGENVRFRWHQEMLAGEEGYESCWALDNVLLVNAAHRPVLLQDSLDPADTTNWLFFPGATVKHACQSEGNAMYFHGTEGSGFSFASTRDVDLSREEGHTSWREDFEASPEGWQIQGAVYGADCGTVASGLSLVFLQDGERRVCTPFLDTTAVGNLRLYFTMGSGLCDPGVSHDNDVTLYGRIQSRKDHFVLDVLSYSSYRTPTLVSVPVPTELQSSATQFCLEQRNHAGLNHNVWAIDYFHLLPVLPVSQSHMIQFSINLGCGSYQPANSVSLEFSTNSGRIWSLLHTECLPELCTGVHLPHSTVYSSDNYSGWSRITIPLPNAPLTGSTRFRWRQNGPGVGNMWAIDNVYIGPSCLKFCSGRGQCTRNGCKCDPGFSGPACELASQTFPAFVSESFLSPRLSSYHNFQSIRGAEVSFGCGVLASGKALVFSKDGRRHLVTSFLDSTQARYLQFTLRLGSRSKLSTCKAPDQAGEGVLLHFSFDNGITWKLLQHFSYRGFHEPRIVSVQLPDEAKKFGVQFRWWQPYHSGRGQDVWAVDEIIMTSILFNSISLDFNNLVDVTQSLGFYLGNVQPYCGHDWTLSFSGDPSPGSSIRYVETQSMQTGASYMIQFSLVMGCGKDFSPNMDNQISLEYSTNHGLTWHLVQEACLPGMPSCPEFTSASIYHPSEFARWRRITLPLPQKTWSSATRFRWIQSYYLEQDEWALDNIYIGQQCPHMCHGHGWCKHGVCSCDDGFTGVDCQPQTSLSSNVMSDFELKNTLHNTWQEVIGGEIVRPEEGCGVISSGSSLYFSKAGRRHLVSWDLDTSWVDFLQFYLRIGGDTAECNRADSREEGVLLQYSNNGGITWGLLAEMYFSDFIKPRFVYYELPEAARTPCTRFRWWQPLHSGEGYDQWAVDDIIILSEKEKHIIPVIQPTLPQNFYEKPAYDFPLNQLSMWLILANEGMEKNASFCANTPSAMVFGKSDGDRFAITRDLTLKPGYTLQFKLNIGCFSQHNPAAPVLLQYSHDAGRSWSLVQEGCYPASPGVRGCEGSSRELREPTSYSAGDFEQWSRVTIVIPRAVAASKTRFRWIQETSGHKSAPPFALDGVYISEPCANHCGGHGDCISGVCYCDIGYTVEKGTCVPKVPNPSEMMDHFDGKLSPLWSQITGGQVGSGCGILSDGKTLYFNSPGRREARTVPLDTTNIRFIQFYIRIGSKNLGSSCNKPRTRNEGIVVQFSDNNGITWELLRELDFTSFPEPQVATIELPPEAKTPGTVFRWWQPLHGKHSAQWALDDVLIGMNDSCRMAFQDKFDGSMDLQVNWYRIQGGQVEVDCLSMDTALVFNMDIGKPRYAETWDFHITSSSFLQFEMSTGCSKPFTDDHSIQLQYSLSTGRDWHLVTPECVPPAIGCATYTESSVYTSQRFQNWRRVTVFLPSVTISPRTRFRWIQMNMGSGTDSWALDNVLLTSGCPWMCSGHGICDAGCCVCDRGFGGPYCVPLTPLPSILKDDFDGNLHSNLWPEVYGAERGTLNGEPLKSGMALIFKGEGLRMLVSRDLDCTNTLYMQFSFKFITKGIPDRSSSVLLQFSVNGGIAWQLLDELYFPQATEGLFLHVPLPAAAQTNATRFRFWQPHNTGKKEEVWVIDDIIIDGNSARNSEILTDSFETEPREENWLFHPGGSIGLYCPYLKGMQEDNTAMVFVSSELGEHSITTRDLDVTDSTIIQFEINVGCTSDSSATEPVRLEFSRDFGATWHILVPLCHSSSHLNSLCSTEHHPASIYYPGTTQGWRREIIHVGKLHLCGSVRFRWYQGFFNAGMSPMTWALDNVYIGPQCEDMCTGHGLCINGTHCKCDKGFSGPSCKISSSSNPDFLKEDFEGSLDKERFLLVTGGKPSRKCGVLPSGNNLFFSEEGLRMLVTMDLDLSNARFVQFFLRLGCGKGAPDPRSQPVLLQYSLDGGLSWGLLQEFLFSNSSNLIRYVALEIPLRARSPATRLRWWQPSENGHFYSPWVIDQVVVGGSISGISSLEDDFSSLSGRSWLLHPGGTLMPVCGSSGDAFAFIEKANIRYAISTDISLGQDSFIQFDFSASCSVSNSCYAIELEFSQDLGLTWEPLLRDCLPTNVDCTRYQLQKVLLSDTFNKWGRITLPIPPYARSPATRFRWYQPAPFDKQQTWALDNLYIGDGCVDMCSGHGRCVQGTCVCDDQWGSLYCDEPESPLPTQLKDNFNRPPSAQNWLLVNGGKLSAICGAVASGTALHFSGGCTRQLVTVDLNLTNADFIQFYFMYGCLIPPSNRNQGVLLEYSTNGGISWNMLTEIFYDQYSKPGFLNILLPTAAQTVGVRIRWWQPKHDGLDQNDWAVDNVLIAGATDQRSVIVDTFSGTVLPQHERLPADAVPTGRIFMEPRIQEAASVSTSWMFHDDCLVERFCDVPDGVMVCGSHDGREVYAVTHDLVPSHDWIMQFKIVVGCRSTEKISQNQVHVQYSLDFGVTWKYVVPQCLPADPECAGQVSQPSVFFPTRRWKRIIYPLPDFLVGNSVRFRFYQKFSDVQWAIDNFYIGPACPDNCGGQGDCLMNRCLCDPGYSGPNCYLNKAIKSTLKERFDSEELHSESWLSVEGGRVCTECGVLVEDTALYFGGANTREAVTVDLDLRGAKFVEYWAQIGSENNITSCHRPVCRKEGVLLDFSTNGGVTWTLLHEMDFQKYLMVRRDYIVLPEEAQTNNTRLRWWQPFILDSDVVESISDRAQWAIDNILIGGSEINPSQLVDNFDDEGASHEENWSFYPNAVRTAGFCGNPSFHLYWPNKKIDSTHNILATRELIIQPGYILQFKIVVGCEADSCGELHSVLLEYSKDARSDGWHLVQTECLPSSVNNVGCSPFQFHEATIYSAVNSSRWNRVTVQLPDHISSSATQIRWIQREAGAEKQSWAVDHVYIGEACPKLCSGHGYCTNGAMCICDEGHEGDDCSISSSELPTYIKDNFESEHATEVNWQHIQGGGIGSGCGQLVPHAHGDSLYFNGCKMRQASTKPLDLTRASKIMFVLQIGSTAQTGSCNVDLSEANTMDKAVLLQYSVNNGITWHVIAQHQPKDFIQAQRVSYNIPLEARVKGVQLRWWQPRHNGTGHDQWALDHVEVVLTSTRKQSYMANFSRQSGLRHFYSRKRRALRHHF